MTAKLVTLVSALLLLNPIAIGAAWTPQQMNERASHNADWIDLGSGTDKTQEASAGVPGAVDAPADQQSGPPTPSQNQTLADAYRNQIVTRLVGDPSKGVVGTRTQSPNATIEITNDFAEILVALVANKIRSKYLLAAENSRTDKQVGSTSSSSGSTSLTQKGGVPAVLAFAVENGALTQTISGTTITFRGTPVGIIKALENKGFLESYQQIQSEPLTKYLNNLSFSLSFDTSRGNTASNTQNGTSQSSGQGNVANVFTGDKQQLSEFTIRYEILNHRDPRSDSSISKWDAFFAAKGPSLAGKLGEFSDTFLVFGPGPQRFKNSDLEQWFTETQDQVRKATDAQVDGVLRQRFDALSNVKLTAAEVGYLQRFDDFFQGYLLQRDNLINEINKGGIITLQYTNTRNINTPNLSNFLLIAETGTPTVDATFNGSATTFDRLPAGVTTRVRDFQLSGEVDKSLNNVMGLSKVVLFGTVKFQRFFVDLPNPNAMMSSGTATMMPMTVPNTKGNMVIAQFGLKIPLKDTGFSIPISFSVANRTELIKENTVRGNIGFTFDFNTLFAKLKP